MLHNVHFILFFDIYNAVKTSKLFKTNDDNFNEQMQQFETTSANCEIQTDLHPTPCDKDENYVWNLWDFRRKAIELVIILRCRHLGRIRLLETIFQANLRRKKTTSTQTAFSYHKLDIGNQRYEDRQKGLQTDSSKEMNTE